MKKYLIITLGCLVGACSDFLATTPRGTLYPDSYYDSTENIEAALTGVYSVLGNTRVYGNTYVNQLGHDADESYYFRSTYTYGPAIYNYTPADQNIYQLWSTLYQGIGRANMLLYHLPDADVSDSFKDRIRGEALFLRAYYHFLLVSNYGRIPVGKEPTFTPGETDTPQSELAEIYEFITTDMEEAKDLVRPIEEIGHGGRVSRSAVRGILARVYLTMAGEPLRDYDRFEDARRCLLEILEDTGAGHELNPDYHQIYINYAQDLYDIKESIWEVEFWGNQTDAYTETGTIGGLNGIGNDYDDDIGMARGMYAATGWLYRLYEDGDLRRDRSIAPFSYERTADPDNPDKYVARKVYFDDENVWRRNLGKYRREEETLKPKSAHNTPINFPLLRYSDVLLMYAEVENEINTSPTTEAYDAINQVRRRAFGKLLPGAVNETEFDLSGLDYRSFKEILIDERSRELCFESLRRADLIRWGIFVIRMNAMVDFIEQEANDIRTTGFKPPSYCDKGFRNVSRKHVLHPIPSREMALNKNLKQNQHW